MRFDSDFNALGCAEKVLGLDADLEHSFCLKVICLIGGSA